MSQETQSYANHTRWHPPFHFVAVPIVMIHFLFTAYQLWRNPDLAHAEAFLLAIGLILILLLTRVNALKAQDRLIRLEERLRFQQLLSPALAAKAANLPVRFLVALRFASDEELPALVQQVVDRKFEKPGDVKKAIKNWRGDFFRV